MQLIEDLEPLESDTIERNNGDTAFSFFLQIDLLQRITNTAHSTISCIPCTCPLPFIISKSPVYFSCMEGISCKKYANKTSDASEGNIDADLDMKFLLAPRNTEEFRTDLKTKI